MSCLPMKPRTYPDLKTYLKRTGTSKTAFARKMGVDLALVSRVASGKQTLRLGRALQWSKAARVPLESFLIDSQPQDTL